MQYVPVFRNVILGYNSCDTSVSGGILDARGADVTHSSKYQSEIVSMYMERGHLPLKQRSKFVLQMIVRDKPERYLHSVVWNYGKL